MGTVDLLPQFKAELAPEHVAVDLPPEDEQEGGSGLNAFYDIVAEVNQKIKNMKNWTAKLDTTHNNLHCSTDDGQKMALREEAGSLHDKIKDESQSVKSSLDKMQQLTTEAKRQECEHPAEIRIQENQHMLLRQEFVAALTNFQQVEQSNKEKYKETIKRRIKTKFSHQSVSEEDVEKMTQDVMENGQESQIFSSNKMAIAATTLEEVVEMRKDIHKIETALEELRQIFVDMAVLVAEQGELLNDIRSNVDRATTFVHKGRKETAEARKISERSRKKMCLIILCVIIVVVVVLVVGLAVLK